jgi:hypothetical protein
MPPKDEEGDDDDERVWFTPIEWDERLYLVRDAVAFCEAVARGAEPRRVAAGPDFLRLGDHLKPVGRNVPSACRAKR